MTVQLLQKFSVSCHSFNELTRPSNGLGTADGIPLSIIAGLGRMCRGRSCRTPGIMTSSLATCIDDEEKLYEPFSGASKLVNLCGKEYLSNVEMSEQQRKIKIKENFMHRQWTVNGDGEYVLEFA